MVHEAQQPEETAKNPVEDAAEEPEKEKQHEKDSFRFFLNIGLSQ